MKRIAALFLMLFLLLTACSRSSGELVVETQRQITPVPTTETVTVPTTVATTVPATVATTVPATEAALPPATVPTTVPTEAPTEPPTDESTEPAYEEPETPEPAGLDYVLNKSSKKFHYPHCGSVKQMKAKNRKDFFGSREEVLSMGYVPCKNCHP